MKFLKRFIDLTRDKKINPIYVRRIDKDPIFKQFKWNRMEDLTDCFQEILDKYRVPGEFKHGGDYHYSIGTSQFQIDKNGNRIIISSDSDVVYTKEVYTLEAPALFISNIKPDIFISMYGDLIKMKPTAEKRVSHRLDIHEHKSRNYDYVSDSWVDCFYILISPVFGGEI